MLKLLTLIAALLLLNACSTKEQEDLFKVYEKEKNYHNTLLKTEKVQLYDGQVTKAVLTATYLFTHTEDLNDTRDEEFIVGVYIEDEEQSRLNAAGYTLTLDGTEPKSVAALKKDDPLLKYVSFKADWSEFYLITFPHTSKKSFNLLFESELYGTGKLHFAKVAKYVLTNEPF